MKKPFTVAALSGLVLSLTACSGFRSIPAKQRTTSLGTKTLYSYVESGSNYYLTVYDTATAAEEKRQIRNQITDELMNLVDDDFEKFALNLRTDRVKKNLGVKLVSIGITGAAPFSSGPIAKVLGGIDTGLKGASEAVDLEAWGNQAPGILIDTMRAERAVVAKEINLMRAKPVTEYTLQSAIRDVSAYRSAGFVTTALAALTRHTSATAAARESEAADAKVAPEKVREKIAARLQKAEN